MNDAADEMSRTRGMIGALSDQFNFHSSLFSGGREKPRLSRSEKRSDRQMYTQERASAGATAHPLDISAGELHYYRP